MKSLNAKWILICTLISASAFLTGCASLVGSSSVQSFEELTPILDEEGYAATDRDGNAVFAVARGKSKTVAMPFGAKAITEHGLQFYQDGDVDDPSTPEIESGGWSITMGTSASIDGGDMASLLQELAGVLEKLNPLIDTLHAIKSFTAIEPID